MAIPPAADDAAAYINDHLGGWNRAMGLRFVRATADEVVGELVVADHHRQPYGIVHGGVHTGIIEAACSTGAALHAMPRGATVVGLENTTSFVHAARGGTLTVTARPLTRGGAARPGRRRSPTRPAGCSRPARSASWCSRPAPSWPASRRACSGGDRDRPGRRCAGATPAVARGQHLPAPRVRRAATCGLAADGAGLACSARVRAIGVSLLALAACHGYRAGSFRGPRGPFPGEPVTLGCLDVAVARSHDAGAQGPAVELAFGNRCRRPVTVDLTRMSARGRDAAGQDVRLVAYESGRRDPAAAARRPPGRTRGHRAVATGGADAPLTQVCVDVGGIDRSAAPAARWVCMEASR